MISSGLMSHLAHTQSLPFYQSYPSHLQDPKKWGRNARQAFFEKMKDTPVRWQYEGKQNVRSLASPQHYFMVHVALSTVSFIAITTLQTWMQVIITTLWADRSSGQIYRNIYRISTESFEHCCKDSENVSLFLSWFLCRVLCIKRSKDRHIL